METGPVRFREWTLWVVAFLTFAGVNVGSLRDAVKAAIPAIGWIVGTVSVPWLALVTGGALLAGVGYFAGHRGRRAHPANEEEPQTFVPGPIDLGFSPDPVQVRVLRILRYVDKQVRMSTIVRLSKEVDATASARELELAVRSLAREGWIDASKEWNGREFEICAQIGEAGMTYAKARGFSHSGEDA